MTVVRLPRRPAPEAVAHWRRARAEVAAAAFAPKSLLTLSQWADQKRMLSADLGEPGQWRTSRVPYMRRIMDAITDPRVREVSVRKSARIGATQALVCNTVGYYIDQEPTAIIVALPTIDDATKFSTRLLQPMLDDTPCLAGKVTSPDGGRKKKRSTMLQKGFPGGELQIVGTKSPRAMRMVHGRVILMSEVDGYEHSAGVEGDPTKLLEKRAGAYGNPKFVKESTPLIRATSRIDRAYEAGSQEEYHVPCPHCGEYQMLVWGGRDVPYGIKWDDDPAKPYYVCQANGCVIDEVEKHGMVAAGRWVAKHPERVDHLSFWLNALVSPFDGARWALLVKEWYDAQGKPEQLKVFVNTILGESWEEEGQKVASEFLAGRFEAYPCECAPGEHVPQRCSSRKVPARVALLTRSVDVQGDRLETVVWGWGDGEEAWPIEHEIIPGDPATPTPWQELKLMFARDYRHETGAVLRPAVTFVDSGGHHTKEVYQFCRRNAALRVFAVKGSSQAGAPLLGRASHPDKAKTILYPIGTFAAKEAIMARMAKVTQPGPGYVHIPDWMESEHLEQLTAEKLITRMVGGYPKRVWVKDPSARNEQLDLLVYAMAALHLLGPNVYQRLGAIAQRLAAEAEQKRAKPNDGEPSQQQRSRPPRRGSGWVHNY